jgi:hypothetical protein
MLRRKFIAINAYVKNLGRSQINDLFIATSQSSKKTATR